MRVQPAEGAEPLAACARAAGLAYVIIRVAGIYAEFVVRSGLIVRGDAAATAACIARSELLFRSGIASEFVMLACDVVVAVTLYMVFESVSRTLSLLAAFLRLAHAAVVGSNLINTARGYPASPGRCSQSALDGV